MRLIYALSLFALIETAHCGCLARKRVGQVSRCMVDENPVSDGFLQELCKNLTSIAELSIVGEYKGQLSSFRTLGNYCALGPVGRLSWVRNKEIYEFLLNSNDVDIVSRQIFPYFYDCMSDWISVTFNAHGATVDLISEKIAGYQLIN